MPRQPPPPPPPVPKPLKSPPPLPPSDPFAFPNMPPRPAGSRSPFPFGSCQSSGPTIGKAYQLTYGNASRNSMTGDWSYCFSVVQPACSQPRCCGIDLDLIQFLIDDNCYGAVYGLTINGFSRSANYHVYDVTGYTYTVLKFTALGIPYGSAGGTRVCFSLRANVCQDLRTMCQGPTCDVALGNSQALGSAACCPTQNYLVRPTR